MIGKNAGRLARVHETDGETVTQRVEREEREIYDRYTQMS